MSKQRKTILEKYDFVKKYPLAEATGILKNIALTKFDSTVDVSFNLGVDIKKSDQMMRGTVSLPHGLGKKITILAICNPEDVDTCKEAGADYAGLEEFLEKIKSGWTAFDIIICHPSLMGKLGSLGKVLGPKGLMPNPKSGTVVGDVPKAVKEFKDGKIDYRTDKYGIIHASIGKVSFDAQKLNENFMELFKTLIKTKPSSTKGIFIKSVFLSSSMSPSIKIDHASLN